MILNYSLISHQLMNTFTKELCSSIFSPSVNYVSIKYYKTNKSTTLLFLSVQVGGNIIDDYDEFDHFYNKNGIVEIDINNNIINFINLKHQIINTKCCYPEQIKVLDNMILIYYYYIFDESKFNIEYYYLNGLKYGGARNCEL